MSWNSTFNGNHTGVGREEKNNLRIVTKFPTWSNRKSLIHRLSIKVNKRLFEDASLTKVIV